MGNRLQHRRLLASRFRRPQRRKTRPEPSSISYLSGHPNAKARRNAHLQNRSPLATTLPKPRGRTIWDWGGSEGKSERVRGEDTRENDRGSFGVGRVDPKICPERFRKCGDSEVQTDVRGCPCPVLMLDRAHRERRLSHSQTCIVK